MPMSTLETLSLFLGVWLLFLLLVISSSRLQSSASRRANALLQEMVSESQYEQWLKFGYLEVSSPSIENRIYRIPGSDGLVKVYESGQEVMDLCLQPAEPLPESDVVLLHKLMIEGNEQEYLQKANHFAPHTMSLCYQHL